MCDRCELMDGHEDQSLVRALLARRRAPAVVPAGQAGTRRGPSDRLPIAAAEDAK